MSITLHEVVCSVVNGSNIILIELHNIKLLPQPEKAASYEENHTYLLDSFEKALSIALPAIRDEHDKGAATKQGTLDKYRIPYCNLRLPDTSSAIRLLEILPGSFDDPVIQTRLFVANLESVEKQYEALSYTWGDADSPSESKTVRLNGLKKLVTRNLYSALLSLRRPSTSRTVWVDSLCINQGDSVERMHQVILMAKIYKLAHQVIVYLGPATDLSNAFINFLKSGDREEPTSTDSDPEEYTPRLQLRDMCRRLSIKENDVLEGFIDISSRSWWSRVWTLQEYVLSKQDPVLHCGRDEFSNEIFHDNFEQLSDWAEHVRRHPVPLELCSHPACARPSKSKDQLAKNINTSEGTSQGNGDGPCETRDHWAVEKSPFPQQSSQGREWAAWGRRIQLAHEVMDRRSRCRPWNTPEFLYRRFRSQCSDPHDIVYGVRELMEPLFKDMFKPDYTLSVPELFTRLAVYLLVFDSWTDLFFHYPYRLDPSSYGEDGKDIPSWTPDFTKPIRPREAEKTTVKSKQIRRTVDSNPLIMDRVLFIRGWLVDEIISVYPLPDADPYGLLQQLWYFERRHGRPKYKLFHDHETHEGIDTETVTGLHKMSDEVGGVTAYPSVAWATQYSETLPADISIVDIIYFVGDFATLFTDVFKEFGDKIPEVAEEQLEEEKKGGIRDIDREFPNHMNMLAAKGLEKRRRYQLRSEAIDDLHKLFKYLLKHSKDFVGISIFDYDNLCSQVRYLVIPLDLKEAVRQGFVQPRETDDESEDGKDGPPDGCFNHAVTQQPFFYLDLIGKILDGRDGDAIRSFMRNAVLTLSKRIHEKAQSLVGLKGDNLYSTVQATWDDLDENKPEDDTSYEILMVPMRALPTGDDDMDHVSSGSHEANDVINYEEESTESQDTHSEVESTETASSEAPQQPLTTKEPYGEWMAWRCTARPSYDVHLTLTDVVDFLKGRELFVTESGLVGLSCPGAQPLKDGDDVFILEGMSFPLVGRLEFPVFGELDNGDLVKLRRRNMSSIRMRREIRGACILKGIETKDGSMDEVVWPDGFESISTLGAFRFK